MLKKIQMIKRDNQHILKIPACGISLVIPNIAKITDVATEFCFFEESNRGMLKIRFNIDDTELNFDTEDCHCQWNGFHDTIALMHIGKENIGKANEIHDAVLEIVCKYWNNS